MATPDRGVVATVPPIRVSRSTSQAFAAGTDAAVSFDTEQFDLDDWHKAAATTRLVCPAGRAGQYLVAGALDFDGTTAGQLRAASIRRNGNKIVEVVANSPAAHQGIQVFDFVTLAVGDYLELWGYSQPTANVSVTYFQPWLGLTYISS